MSDFKDLHGAYVRAYGSYMSGQITWEEFEPIKKAFGKEKSKLAKTQKEAYKSIEQDLQKKYPEDYKTI